MCIAKFQLYGIRLHNVWSECELDCVTTRTRLLLTFSAHMRDGCCSCLVCVSVCLSVTALAASVSIFTCNQRYSKVSLRWILIYGFSQNFPFKGYGSQYANGVELTVSHFRALSEGQQLPGGQLAGRMLLQSLATGATGVKPAR